MKRSVALAGAAALFLAAQVPGVATATTDSTTFSVSATMAGSATVTADPISFGAYNELSATPTDASTTITVAASAGLAYRIDVSHGNNATGAPTRAMTNENGGYLRYGLYQDAARTIFWGTGTTDYDGYGLETTGTGTPQVHAVYGRIPAGQTTGNAGSYSDTVYVSITY